MVTTSAPIGDTPRVQINVASSPTVNGALTVYRTHEDGTEHRVLLKLGDGDRNVCGVGCSCAVYQAVTYPAEAAGLVSAESAAQWSISDDTTWSVHRSDPTSV